MRSGLCVHKKMACQIALLAVISLRINVGASKRFTNQSTGHRLDRCIAITTDYSKYLEPISKCFGHYSIVI